VAHSTQEEQRAENKILRTKRMVLEYLAIHDLKKLKVMNSG
jgi:hypothetical protein